MNERELRERVERAAAVLHGVLFGLAGLGWVVWLVSLTLAALVRR